MICNKCKKIIDINTVYVTIGLDNKTICKPCFKEDHRGKGSKLGWLRRKKRMQEMQ